MNTHAKRSPLTLLALLVAICACMGGFALAARRADAATQPLENALVAKLAQDQRVIGFAASDGQAAVVREDASLWVSKAATEPYQVMADVSSVSMAGGTTVAVTTDGTLWAWGRNDQGQLGTGTTNDAEAPLAIMNDVRSASVGEGCVAAVRTDGTLWMWGNGAAGQFGTGAEGASLTPQLLMDGVQDVALCATRGVIVTTEGHLLVWNAADAEPLRVLDNVARVSAGTQLAAAVKTDGTLWLGTGTNDAFAQADTNVAQALVDGDAVVVLATDGTLHQVTPTEPAPAAADEQAPAAAEEPAEVVDQPVEQPADPQPSEQPQADEQPAEPVAEAVSDDPADEQDEGELYESATNISKATVSGVPAKMGYTGNALTPKPTLKVGKTTLKENTDYTLKYSNNTNKGTATITISGKGSYSGSRKVTFKIVERTDFSKTVSIAAVGTQNFTGKEIKPKLTVKVGNTTLKEGTDYSVDYWDYDVSWWIPSNVVPGTAHGTITGKGLYKGSKSFTFKIVADISKASVYVESQIYSGKALKPKPSSFYLSSDYGGYYLEENVDYTITSYANNVKVGTATMTITGKGNFKGTKKISFSIVGPSWKRLAGAGRYQTMNAIVNEGWSWASTVIVARGDDFKDALAACGLAGISGAPVVLTSKSALTSEAEAQLKRLNPSRVYVVGGPGAVSSKVYNSIVKATGLKKQANNKVASTGVIRVYGENALDTAAKIALAGKGNWADNTAIIATSGGFKDALSVAPVAYAKHWPILLSSPSKGLVDEALKAMETLKIKQVYIVGGVGAVSKDVEQQLADAGITVKARLAGNNGCETSRAIADWAMKNGASANGMGFATSNNFPDALAGAALCGSRNSVLVLANQGNKSTEANVSFATKHQSKIRTGYVFGGPGAFNTAMYLRLPNGGVAYHTGGVSNATRDRIITAGLGALGLPYYSGLGGGSLKTGFDCSGFVYYCYTQAGKSINLGSLAQYSQAKKISTANLATLKPGDLVFWVGTTGVRAGNHVAIYLGGGMIMHSYNAGSRITGINGFGTITSYGYIA